MLPTLLVAALVAAPPGPDARELFLANCASCHGKEGAGDGWTELDRPARSFLDGGFSYGNTEEALFRTITHGIPGTPMPSFATSLSDDQRRELATYVVTLGPPIEAVSTEDTVVVVGEEPVVVRGYLPPIGEGAKAHPRGLLVGHPSGLTFEYRTDDLRLLGVRQGGFVERRDWVGRGGAALKPTGKPVWLMEGGDPRPEFSDGEGDLSRNLRTTHAQPNGLVLRSTVHRADGARVAVVLETCRPADVPGAAGFLRSWLVALEGDGLRARLASWKGRSVLATFQDASRTDWIVTRGDDGVRAIRIRVLPRGPVPEVSTARVYLADGAATAAFALGTGAGMESMTIRLETTLLSLAEWNDDVEAALRAL